jgi:hypothetical protein
MLAMGALLRGTLPYDCIAINAIIAILACGRWTTAHRLDRRVMVRWIGRRHGALAMSSKLLAVTFLVLTGGALAQPAPPDNKPDATLRSTPETVVWGYFAADIPPALRIKSGQAVRVDTVSHGGVNTGVDPVTFFNSHGVAAGRCSRMRSTSTRK